VSLHVNRLFYIVSNTGGVTGMVVGLVLVWERLL